VIDAPGRAKDAPLGAFQDVVPGKRRADVVGISPKEASIIRLVGAVLLELNDEWQLQRRYIQPEAMAELTPALVEVLQPQISTAAE
jgi:putative transposase